MFSAIKVVSLSYVSVFLAKRNVHCICYPFVYPFPTTTDVVIIAKHTQITTWLIQQYSLYLKISIATFPATGHLSDAGHLPSPTL